MYAGIYPDIITQTDAWLAKIYFRLAGLPEPIPIPMPNIITQTDQWLSRIYAVSGGGGGPVPNLAQVLAVGNDALGQDIINVGNYQGLTASLNQVNDNGGGLGLSLASSDSILITAALNIDISSTADIIITANAGDILLSSPLGAFDFTAQNDIVINSTNTSIFLTAEIRIEIVANTENVIVQATTGSVIMSADVDFTVTAVNEVSVISGQNSTYFSGSDFNLTASFNLQVSTAAGLATFTMNDGFFLHTDIGQDFISDSGDIGITPAGDLNLDAVGNDIHFPGGGLYSGNSFEVLGFIGAGTGVVFVSGGATYTFNALNGATAVANNAINGTRNGAPIKINALV